MTSEDLLFPQEFSGWRGWQLEEGRLISMTDSSIWEPRQAYEFMCSKGHEAPKPNCSCGIYSVKSLADLRRQKYHDQGVIGQVSIWGRILEGSKGFRAEFAYPRVIYVPYLSWREAEDLHVYGVPVKLLNPYSGKAT